MSGKTQHAHDPRKSFHTPVEIHCPQHRFNGGRHSLLGNPESSRIQDHASIKSHRTANGVQIRVRQECLKSSVPFPYRGSANSKIQCLHVFSHTFASTRSVPSLTQMSFGHHIAQDRQSVILADVRVGVLPQQWLTGCLQRLDTPNLSSEQVLDDVFAQSDLVLCVHFCGYGLQYSCLIKWRRLSLENMHV